MDGTVGGMRRRSRRQSAYAAASTSSGHQKAMGEPARGDASLSRVRGERRARKPAVARDGDGGIASDQRRSEQKMRNPTGPDRKGSTLPPIWCRERFNLNLSILFSEQLFIERIFF